MNSICLAVHEHLETCYEQLNGWLHLENRYESEHVYFICNVAATKVCIFILQLESVWHWYLNNCISQLEYIRKGCHVICNAVCIPHGLDTQIMLYMSFRFSFDHLTWLTFLRKNEMIVSIKLEEATDRQVTLLRTLYSCIFLNTFLIRYCFFRNVNNFNVYVITRRYMEVFSFTLCYSFGGRMWRTLLVRRWLPTSFSKFGSSILKPNLKIINGKTKSIAI